MFGECIDFARVEPKGRKASYVPPKVPQLSPTVRELANKLASQAGINPTWLDGVSADTLSKTSVKELTTCIRQAVASLQFGPSTSGPSGNELRDTLRDKIERLPLASRFRFMEDWGQPSQRQESGPIEGSFISFDDSTGSTSRSKQGIEAALRKDEEAKRKKQAKEEEAKRRKQAKEEEARRRQIDADNDKHAIATPGVTGKPAAFFNDAPVDTGQARQSQVIAAPGPVTIKPAMFLTEISFDAEQMKRDVERREQDAKEAASKVLLNLQNTKMVSDAGLLAARQSTKADPSKDELRDEGGSSRRDDVDRADVDRKDMDRADDDRAGSPGDQPRRRRRRRRREGEGGLAEDSGAALEVDTSRSRRRREEVEDAFSEARGERGRDEATNRRKRRLSNIFRASPSADRSRSHDDDRRPARGKTDARDSNTRDNEKNIISRPPANSEKKSSAAPSGAAEKSKSAAPDDEKPSVNLRILGCKNGWAEYLDEDTQTKVFKNVLTGEMTKTKPTEMQTPITAAQNQRRLSWLASHRAAAAATNQGNFVHGLQQQGAARGGFDGFGFR